MWHQFLRPLRPLGKTGPGNEQAEPLPRGLPEGLQRGGHTGTTFPSSEMTITTLNPQITSSLLPSPAQWSSSRVWSCYQQHQHPTAHTGSQAPSFICRGSLWRWDPGDRLTGSACESYVHWSLRAAAWSVDGGLSRGVGRRQLVFSLQSQACPLLPPRAVFSFPSPISPSSPLDV